MLPVSLRKTWIHLFVFFTGRESKKRRTKALGEWSQSNSCIDYFAGSVPSQSVQGWWQIAGGRPTYNYIPTTLQERMDKLTNELRIPCQPSNKRTYERTNQAATREWKYKRANERTNKQRSEHRSHENAHAQRSRCANKANERAHLRRNHIQERIDSRVREQTLE